jgi:two-component system, OmpR family, aerobic respiration control sensor histidine kinase ArcB
MKKSKKNLIISKFNTIEDIEFYYRNLISVLPNNVYWLDTNLKGVGCNSNTLKILGLTSIDQFIGISYEKMATLSGGTLEQAIQFKKRDIEVIKTAIAQINIEEKLLVKGEVIYFLTSRVPLFDKKNNVIGVVGISTDITDRKRTEKALRLAKKRAETASQAIIAAMPNNVFWWSKNGKALGCNYNTLKFLGLNSVDEFIGMTYERAAELAGWTGGQAKSFEKDDLQVINTGTPILNKEEPPISDIHGKLFYYVTSRVPLFDKQNNIIGTLGISTDITERKQVEQIKLAKEKAEIANKAKTEFLENMRHDIRTPLSGIVGCAQLIQIQADNPKKVAEYVDDLVQSSNALLEFLNKILESIQVASGEIPLLKRRFNLYQALEQIVQLNKPQANVKHLNLQLDYDKTIPAYLLGDPVRVQRILLELLTNALKFTDKGEIKVVARLMKSKTQSGRLIVKLSVCDTGIGIPLDQQNEVYTRFKRLTPSYQGIYPGTGLGLSVVKQFMADLDGEIQLDSKPNQGSTFTCLIPFQESFSTENGNEVEEVLPFAMDICLADKKVAKVSTTQEAVITTGSHVLLVEDNLIAAKLAQNVLSNMNCRIDRVENGKAALLCVKKNHYDLILMDVGLPDVGGCELTQRIRLKQGHHNRSVPIVGLTAHIEIEKKQHCLANGMNAVYTKPLTPEKATEILNVFISDSLPSQMAIDNTNNALQDVALINVEQALQLIGSKKLAKETWNLLANSLTEELVEIKQYHEVQDWTAIKAMAHKWRGGASYCGANRLEEACQQLEAVIRVESYKAAEGLYQQLLQVAEITKQAAKKVVVS